MTTTIIIQDLWLFMKVAQNFSMHQVYHVIISETHAVLTIMHACFHASDSDHDDDAPQSSHPPPNKKRKQIKQSWITITVITMSITWFITSINNDSTRHLYN